MARKGRLCSQATSNKNAIQLLCLDPARIIWIQEAGDVLKENTRFCNVWSCLHASSQPACPTCVFWLWEAVLSFHAVPGAQSTAVTGASYRSKHIALELPQPNAVREQGREAWPLFIYLYFWFYSTKLSITSKSDGFKTMTGIIPLNFRKHAIRKQWLPNIFNLSGIVLNPCREQEHSCSHSELDTLAELEHVLIRHIMLNLKPSPKCLWNLKGLSTHFFLT